MASHDAAVDVVVDLFPEVQFTGKLRVAYVCGPAEVGAWLAQGLGQHCRQIQLYCIQGGAGAMASLRERNLELVLLGHEPGHLDAPAIVQAMRLSGAEEPVVVLGRESAPEMAVCCFEAGADDYLCVQSATVEMLLWSIRRAVARAQLVQQNRLLQQQRQQALEQEQVQAAGRLEHHDRLVRHLQCQDAQGLQETTGGPGVSWGLGALVPLPESLQAFYLDLLRAFVVMGCGSLQQEVEQLAVALGRLALPVPRVIQLHRHALQTLLRGRGNRSCRHLLARADMLLVELLAHLARWYRACYAQAQQCPRQLWLPGLDPVECGHASQ